MTNRFDICMWQLQSRERSAPVLQSGSDQHGAEGDLNDAKPTGRRQPLAEKGNAKHRHQHDA